MTTNESNKETKRRVGRPRKADADLKCKRKARRETEGMSEDELAAWRAGKATMKRLREGRARVRREYRRKVKEMAVTFRARGADVHSMFLDMGVARHRMEVLAARLNGAYAEALAERGCVAVRADPDEGVRKGDIVTDWALLHVLSPKDREEVCKSAQSRLCGMGLTEEGCIRALEGYEAEILGLHDGIVAEVRRYWIPMAWRGRLVPLLDDRRTCDKVLAAVAESLHTPFVPVYDAEGNIDLPMF